MSWFDFCYENCRIDLFAKYWAANEMTYGIIEKEILLPICYHGYTENTIYYEFLCQILKKEWFR